MGIARNPDPHFWSTQRVLLTGHTGFKGAWLSLWLEHLGAKVFGLALPPETEPSLFALLQPFAGQVSTFGDIRCRATVAAAVAAAQPTIAIHMAAQPLVRRSYREPVETFAANVMGAAHVLDALRGAAGLKAVLVITTDKVYLNHETGRAFLEDDPLGGDDPYSGSKAGAEMVARSWAHSFLRPNGVPVATARAGNVIGGGDWSEDRLVPDIWRAARAGKAVELRYPDATRPWQHVLDPLSGYLTFVEELAADWDNLPAALNFGPSACETLTVGEVATAISKAMGLPAAWTRAPGAHPPEMKYLSLDASLATASLGWKPRLAAADALGWTADWYRAFDAAADARAYSREQIIRYETLSGTE
jgi:CDP-glucose 4,6-dehydratase